MHTGGELGVDGLALPNVVWDAFAVIADGRAFLAERRREMARDQRGNG